jgi:hypothetical protein
VSTRTLALVESPTQLLNVAEWAHASGATDGLRIVVLAPRDPQTVRQLNRVSALVTGALGLAVRIRDVRTGPAGALVGAAQVLGELARAQRLVIGDPFSRFIQTLLPAWTADDVVIVDDGTATWHFARCIEDELPLVRWGRPVAGSPRRATRAGRLLSPSLSRSLTVFSCLAEATPIGARALANRYEWTRSTRRPDIIDDQVDILGVSLVGTGLVERDAYLDAVGRLSRGAAAVRYIAHRREPEEMLAEIGRLPGVTLQRFDLPVELALRHGPVARRIITFPSTAAHTLPVVLSDVPARIEVQRIEPSWFTPEATVQARAFVARIADAAPPPRPVLEIA